VKGIPPPNPLQEPFASGNVPDGCEMGSFGWIDILPWLANAFDHPVDFLARTIARYDHRANRPNDRVDVVDHRRVLAM
jgi:hypothetical protein